MQNYYPVTSKKHYIKKIIPAVFSLLIISISFIIPAQRISAEGENVTLKLVTGVRTANIGRTFTVTLQASPNVNVDIQGFNASFRFDDSRLELLRDGNSPQIIRPSSVPSSFLLGASVSGNQINIFCEDPSLEAPVRARGDTSLITFTFRVRDNASPGSSAAFTLTEGNVTTIYMQTPESVPTTLASPVSVTIGERLDVNNFLSSLEIDGYELSPSFARDVYDYRITVPEDVTSVSLNVQREAETSSVNISGADSLNFGDNMVIVSVTAQDPERIRNYRITVTREFPAETGTPETETPETETPETEITPVATPEPSPEPTAEEETSTEPEKESLPSDGFWRTFALVVSGLFLVTFSVMVWLIVDKVSGRDKPVKIKRR